MKNKKSIFEEVIFGSVCLCDAIGWSSFCPRIRERGGHDCTREMQAKQTESFLKG